MTDLPEDIVGAIQLALVGAADDAVAIEIIRSLVSDYPTKPEALRPTRLLLDTIHALGGTFSLNQGSD